MLNKFFLLFTIFSFFIVSGCVSTPSNMEKMDNENAKIIEITDIPNSKKDELFIRANSWMVDVFVNAEGVIQFSDKQAGLIKGKYIFDTSDGVYIVRVRSVITINIKEEKARFSIKNPTRKIIGDLLGGGPYNKNYDPIESRQFFDEKVKPKFSQLANSFKSSIQAEASSW